ncbi:fibronectin type III domain-containing protein [Fibrella sp. WM1]|uniref:fibronectin type III domain-containing protein n=1 Tax=Fibrella musci TaxID=3242485 RepID=UPI003522960B
MKAFYSLLLLLTTITATAQVAPTGFTLDVVSNTEIKLSWNHDGKGIDKFVIEKSTDGVVYRALASPATTSRSFNDKGLNANTVYFYRMYAALGARNSTTVSAKATTLSNPPTGFGITAASTVRIDLAWNSGGFPTLLEYSKNADFSGASAKRFTTEQSGFVDGLTPNTGYYFRLKRTTYNGSQESDWVQAKAATQDARPATPTGLAVTSKNTNSLGIKWNAVTGVEGYQARRANVPDFTKGLITQDISFLQTSYTFTNLNDNTSYYMQVRAKNTVGGIEYWSDWSNTVNATTDLGPPLAPTGVQATPILPTRVDVIWTDNSDNEENFIISRSSAGSNGPWTEAGRVGVNIKTFTDNGAQPNTTYYYQVCASNKTSQACALSAKINTPIQTPTAPTALVVAIAGTTATLTWKDNASNEVDYEIQRKEGNGAFADFGKTGAFNGAGTFTDIKLFAGRTYCYRVRSTNAGGPSDYSNEACASTAPAPPNAPTNLQLTLVSASQIDLSWADGGGATSFFVQRAEGSGSFGNIDNLDASKTTYADRTVQVGKTYSYRISATNVSGNALSEVKTITVPTVPAAPEYSLQVLSSTDIKVDYRNTAGANATTLELQYALDNGFATGLGGQNVPVAGSTVTIGSLQPNTRYFFRLRASHSVTRLASDWVLKDATTNATLVAPSAPANLKATTVSSTQIDLGWTAAVGLTGYKLEYADNAAFANLKTETGLAGTANAFSVQSLLPNTTYYFRLYAINGVGTSPAATADARTAPAPLTKPAAPTNLNLSGSADGRVITIGWTDASSNEDRFDIQYAETADFANPTATNVGAGVVTGSVNNLQPCRTYYVRVAATNSAGSSDWLSGKITLSPNVPGKAASLAGTAVSQSQIDLAWTYTASTEEAFELEYADNGNYANSTKRDLAKANRTEAVTGLKAGTPYWLRLRAKNCGGGGDWLETTATTQTSTPVTLPAPTSLRFATSSPVFTQLSLLWTDVATTETGYEVWRADNDQTNWNRVAQLPANAATFTDVGLRAGVPYFYRVRAVQNTTFSDWSNVITDRAPLVSAVSLPAEVRVYPNPTSDLLTIDCPSGGSGVVQILSVAGLPVLEQRVSSLAGRFVLDLRALPTGLYVVTVSTTTTRFSTRLLKR